MRTHSRLVALVGLFLATTEVAAQDLLDRIKMGVDEAQRFKQQMQAPPAASSQPGQQSGGQQSLGQQGAGQLNAGLQNVGQLNPFGLTARSDCCTPEATARLAATAGFIDIVGIKLGMPVRDAVQAVRAANAEMKVSPVDIARLEALPQTELTASAFAQTNPQGQGGEAIGLALTLPPNEPYVWGVTRNIRFAAQEMPTAETLVASLRTKYGPESFKVSGTDQMVWIFDAQGRQVAGQKAQAIFSTCSAAIWHIAAYAPASSGDLPNTKVHGQLKSGYYGTTNGKDPSGGACASNSVIQVLYTISAAPSQPRLVKELKINAANHQLEYSAIEASHRMLVEASSQLDSQRNQEASARSGPKL
jgi:hypothetical protein